MSWPSFPCWPARSRVPALCGYISQLYWAMRWQLHAPKMASSWRCERQRWWETACPIMRHSVCSRCRRWGTGISSGSCSRSGCERLQATAHSRDIHAQVQICNTTGLACERGHREIRGLGRMPTDGSAAVWLPARKRLYCFHQTRTTRLQACVPRTLARRARPEARADVSSHAIHGQEGGTPCMPRTLSSTDHLLGCTGSAAASPSRV
jgi:hypothetical protein